MCSASEGEAASPLWTERIVEREIERGLPSMVTLMTARDVLDSLVAPSLVCRKTTDSLPSNGRTARRARILSTFLY